MRTLIRFSILGLVVELISLLGFIGIAKTWGADPGKQMVMAACFIAIAALTFIAVNLLSFKQLILLALFWTLGFVAISQVLGFAFFPGLVKGLRPFSAYHLAKTATATMELFICCIGGMCAILAIRRLLKI